VLAELHQRIRPTVLAAERTLPVPAALAPLFPVGGLVRGSSLALNGPGATSVALSLLAELTRTGSWVAVVGLGSLGWAAAADAGVVLRRTVAVTQPPLSQWAVVVAALVDAVDVVVVDPRHQVRATDAHRLAARARERGTVMMRLTVPDGARRFRWPSEADVAITAQSRWSGLRSGWGSLEPVSLRLTPSGRRGRPVAPVEVVIGPAGSVESAGGVGPAGSVPRLRRVV